MFTPLREALYFSRNQFVPLITIALIFAVPSYLLDTTSVITSTDAGFVHFITILVAISLNLLPFASAILYIDAVSQNRPITVTQAITKATQQLHWLILLNILLGAIVVTGLMLLIIPGVFLAYKLLFAEFYLLLHRQMPMSALKASYKATTGLAGEIIPPVLVWLGAVFFASWVIVQLFGMETQASMLIHQLVMSFLSLYGWALLYRLYQRFLEAQVPDESDF